MRSAMVKSLLGILLIILIAPACAHAQYLGSVSPATVQQTLAPPLTACTGAAQFFAVQNLGQGNHYAAALSIGTTSFQMNILGYDTAGNVYVISDDAKNQFGVVTGSGYFPQIKVRVTCLPAVTGTFTLTYSGGSSIHQINSGGYQNTQLDKTLFTGVAATSDQTDVTTPPFNNSLGTIVFQFLTAASANSNLGVSCSAAGAGGGYSSFIYSLANTTNIQTFAVPSVPCSLLTTSYGHGTGGGTFKLNYIFVQPGSGASPPTGATLSSAINSFPILAEKGARWSVKHTPAVDVQATASKAAGAVGVRHVADCVSYSMGAIAAPAATALTLNVRDGATGAGTIIWSKTLPAPATAALHADGNFCGLNLIGSTATAMTLEFAAGLASEFESVSLTGYDVQ